MPSRFLAKAGFFHDSSTTDYGAVERRYWFLGIQGGRPPSAHVSVSNSHPRCRQTILADPAKARPVGSLLPCLSSRVIAV